MSIRKGLLIYRAPKYQESRQIDIKYGYYSNKANITTQKCNRNKTIYQNHSKNFARRMDLFIVAHRLKGLHVMKNFSKLKGIRECFIWTHFLHSTPKSSDPLAIKIIQRVFRTLKQIRHVTMCGLKQLQKDLKTFKDLLLLKNLRSMTQINFSYSDDPRDLEPFLRVLQTASKRKHWPHFKSLVVDHFSPESYRSLGHDHVKGLKNLLGFLEKLKACESLYKCSEFQIKFPQYIRARSEGAKIIQKITKILPSETRSLDSISLKPSDLIKGGELNLKKTLPILRKLSLKIKCREYEHLYRFSKALIQIQSLENLTSLSLKFKGDPDDIDKLKGDICNALSSLSELRSLNLRFYDFSKGCGGLKRPWLEDAFRAVGKKQKLEDLTLEFSRFKLKKSSQIFKTLCQSVAKLTQLSSLHLEVSNADDLGSPGLIMLANYLPKLINLEYIFLEFSSQYSFESTVFLALMDCLRNNFPLLSSLNLQLQRFLVTRECYQSMYEAIHQMKSLSDLEVRIGGRCEEGVDMELLEAEASKRFSGGIYWD